RMLDAAHDVGQMVNSLILAEQPELAELFVKRYVTASKDRDLPRMLPLYRVLHAMREGLLRSEWLVELEAEHPDRVALADDAARYFHLAGRTARDLLKSA
ncbi:MAG: hypothetical protein GWN05_01215, partial [Gammaproteobacteria bacterium]|nr:hypothetical protein [Gammaproteobacteria bacterium]